MIVIFRFTIDSLFLGKHRAHLTTTLHEPNDHDRARHAQLAYDLPLLPLDDINAIHAAGSDMYLDGDDDDAATARLFLEILDSTDDDIDVRTACFDREGNFVAKK